MQSFFEKYLPFVPFFRPTRKDFTSDVDYANARYISVGGFWEAGGSRQYKLKPILCPPPTRINKYKNCEGAAQIPKIGYTLGSGAFNSVRNITDEKVLRFTKGNQRQLERELNGYEIQIELSSSLYESDLRSLKICKVFEYGRLEPINYKSTDKDEDKFGQPYVYGYCVMQKIDKSFYKYIKSKPNEAADFYKPKIRSLLEVLQFMHEIGYGHFDIKSENIGLIGKEERLLLFDFGCSLKLDSELKRLGTRSFMGPELYQPKLYVSSSGILKESKMDARTDIFAVGMIIINDMFKGRYNDGVASYVKLCKSDVEADVVKLMELMKGDGSMISFLGIKKEDLPEDLFEFLSGLTKFDVEKRFSAEKALGSDWLIPASVPLVSKPTLQSTWRRAPPAESGGKRKSRKILKNKRSYKSSKKSSKKSQKKRSNKSQKYTK
uniref:Protein kinase domain-containing protein n=1 Tax=viral metagenome TaxID=1070528 RepID=A0A6C0JMF5_9ZZZZ